MMRKRRLFLCNFFTSLDSTVMNSSINNPTSSSGRRQFSLLKANNVMAWIFSFDAAAMVLRTALTPFFYVRRREVDP